MSQAALNAIFGHSDIRAGNEMDGREDKEKEWIDGRPTDGWLDILIHCRRWRSTCVASHRDVQTEGLPWMSIRSC